MSHRSQTYSLHSKCLFHLAVEWGRHTTTAKQHWTLHKEAGDTGIKRDCMWVTQSTTRGEMLKEPPVLGITKWTIYQACLTKPDKAVTLQSGFPLSSPAIGNLLFRWLASENLLSPGTTLAGEWPSPEVLLAAQAMWSCLIKGRSLHQAAGHWQAPPPCWEICQSLTMCVKCVGRSGIMPTGGTEKEGCLAPKSLTLVHR